ncbi:MAG: hypothetical protein H6574_03050 [Lewinellaceae bacterium]|nr:hypothetical protein [Saprospiraceae bacterium]MCB9330035.1 hypothetical protein [Lewinellaceae bacterium]
MKNKIVVWGTNAENEKVLIALELRADDNKVLLHTFPESIATEEFVNKLMADWRNDAEVPFPEGHAMQERPLSVTDSLLPDDLKVERGDLITRAQTEWHFAVLSAKLHKAYEHELAEFKEKIEDMSEYSQDVWDGLRGFWDKVQEQARERNLFRHHADQLRDNINGLFDEMKVLRAKVQDEFMASSQKVFEEFSETLTEIEARIAAGGAKLNTIFDDLKKLQRRYRDAKMSNEHRNKLWSRLDGAFKKAKEKKFGPKANEGSLVERHQRRLGGLNDAIRRMEGSIRRDEEELAFQNKKVATTEGQLEAQIRSAKIKMIEERVTSKREKLAEMHQTRSDIERQIENAKAKESKRAEKEAERKKFEEAKKAAKEEIAATIATTTDAESEQKQTEHTEAPEAENEENVLKAAGKILGESMEDMLDSVKAVGKVLGKKAGDLMEEAIDKADDLLGDALEKAEEFAESMKKEKAAPAAEKPAPEAPGKEEKPKAKKSAATKKNKVAEAEVEAPQEIATAEKKPAKAKAKAPAKKAAAPKKKAAEKADTEVAGEEKVD